MRACWCWALEMACCWCWLSPQAVQFALLLSELLHPHPARPARRSKLQEQDGKLRTAIQDKNNFQMVRVQQLCWGVGCGTRCACC